MRANAAVRVVRRALADSNLAAFAVNALWKGKERITASGSGDAHGLGEGSRL